MQSESAEVRIRFNPSGNVSTLNNDYKNTSVFFSIILNYSRPFQIVMSRYTDIVSIDIEMTVSSSILAAQVFLDVNTGRFFHNSYTTRGIYFVSGGSVDAAATYNGRCVNEKMTVTFAKGSSNTWVVTRKGCTAIAVIRCRESNNAVILPEGYWGPRSVYSEESRAIYMRRLQSNYGSL